FPRAAQPLFEIEAAETRLAQWYERLFLETPAEISGLGILLDFARVADGPQIASDDFVERRAFGAGDLDDPVSRISKGNFGDEGGGVISRDRLNQARRKPDDVSIRTRIGDDAEEFQKLGRADDRIGNTGSLNQLLLGDFGAEIALIGYPV